MKDFFRGAQMSLGPYVTAGRFKAFDGSAELFPGIRAIATPGHTPGHSIYAVESKGHKLVLWGDLMHVAAVQFPEAGGDDLLRHRFAGRRGAAAARPTPTQPRAATWWPRRTCRSPASAGCAPKARATSGCRSPTTRSADMTRSPTGASRRSRGGSSLVACGVARRASPSSSPPAATSRGAAGKVAGAGGAAAGRGRRRHRRPAAGRPRHRAAGPARGVARRAGAGARRRHRARSGCSSKAATSRPASRCSRSTRRRYQASVAERAGARSRGRRPT